ncbi:MAG: dTDP-4-dehydrorhamnose reductase [Candidatus Buchananbacteria bacterium RIFCSPHIGHO2_01_FULL_47_11b]|uniref:dTDP-4-dehydrorhamnose reductase n=1 Tax=Candidatus Buchananbacteria bacterium RIFCSPHIGHO2_01_FULL_47_11b TaxID=1797537 RepID=A0A1G1Y7Z1_9BACT|nr:MAG: dTDP-4-dehydrorhamnose reductase [Candidatus Buchananbacteria bacterium RIFCSPHIGHO2_01_FULL_47_11b]
MNLGCMKKKILILGSNGMLGHALQDAFAQFLPTCWDRDEIDIADQQKLEQKLLALQPDIIINAAAYTNVDKAEEEEELATLINGIAVGYIAKVAKQLGAVLVHFSTDYVFDGTKKEGYSETDQPNPINAYGRSKYRGEQELQKNHDQYYLVRTSWLYGPHGKNFVDTILTLAAKQDTIKVVNDQWGKPTYTVDLAAAVRKLIDEEKPFGIYHITNQAPEGGITWYEFAKKIVELKGLECEVVPCTTKEFPRPAKRPQYSAFVDSDKVAAINWDLALKKYLSFRT